MSYTLIIVGVANTRLIDAWDHALGLYASTE